MGDAWCRCRGDRGEKRPVLHLQVKTGVATKHGGYCMLHYLVGVRLTKDRMLLTLSQRISSLKISKLELQNAGRRLNAGGSADKPRSRRVMSGRGQENGGFSDLDM